MLGSEGAAGCFRPGHHSPDAKQGVSQGSFRGPRMWSPRLKGSEVRALHVYRV